VKILGFAKDEGFIINSTYTILKNNLDGGKSERFNKLGCILTLSYIIPFTWKVMLKRVSMRDNLVVLRCAV